MENEYSSKDVNIPKICKSRMNVWCTINEPYEDGSRSVFISKETYPDIFSLRFPDIVKKSREGYWKTSSNGKAKYLIFEKNTLSEEDVETIYEWKGRYEKYVLLGLNKHISNAFTNELDFCLALDYNFIPEKRERTMYGEAEYKLKYKDDIQCLDILSAGLSQALFELTTTFHHKNPVLSITPSEEGCNVSRKLARAVSKKTRVAFIDATLHCNKNSLKNLSIESKVSEWRRIYSCKACVKWADNISGKTIYIIDDLYQSGTTLWSCGKFLKEAGAKHAIGLICVKTLRDSDNK